jgi:CelD/BcsL family acetyltransferase involved in cellulose biosynthesis
MSIEQISEAALMQPRIINVKNLSAEDEKAWRDLSGRALEPNPFYEPDCLIPAAIHQTFGDQIDLVVAEVDGRFHACLPVRRVSRWRGLPYKIVTSQVRRMTYLGTPLVDEEYGLEAVTAVLSALVDERRRGGSRVLVLQDLTEGRVSSLFRAAASDLKLPLVVFESFERGTLGRHDPPGYQQAHSPKTLRNLNRKHRNLAKEIGGIAEILDRGEDPEAIEEYIALEASGYKAENGVAMATVPGEPEYFRDMCGRFASEGRFHLLSLGGTERTAAMIAWFRSGDSVFQFKWSYDEEFSKYSPGLILHTEAMRYFDEKTDARLLDTCTWGENEMVNRLYPDRRTIASYFIVLGPSIRDRLVMRSVVALRPLHRKIYEAIRRDKAEEALRGKRAPGDGEANRQAAND